MSPMRVHTRRTENVPQTASPEFRHHTLRGQPPAPGQEPLPTTTYAPGFEEMPQPPYVTQQQRQQQQQQQQQPGQQGQTAQQYQLGSPVLGDTENVTHLRHAVTRIEERLVQLENWYSNADNGLRVHADRVAAVEGVLGEH